MSRNRRRGQMQIASIILIMGIVVALVGATYFWGRPLIDKRMMVTEVAMLTGFMERLDTRIVHMARSCTDTCSETLNIPSKSFLNVSGQDAQHSDNNSIVLQYPIEYKLMGEQPIPLNTNVLEEYAPYGETNGVLTMKQRLEGQQYMIFLKLRYRELDTSTIPQEGYKIVVVPGSMAGSDKVIVTFMGAETIEGDAHTGGPITNASIRVETV